MGDVSPTPRQLLVESVIFWSIAVILWIGRIISRSIAGGGIKNLQLDDYCMVVTFAFYTALLVLIRVSAEYATNLFPDADLPAILADPQEVANRVYGSKIVIGLEQCMLFSTWGVKTCLLLMYWKLTQHTRWHLFVKILAGYIALGLLVIEITYFGVYCRPFSQYWAVPVDNPQCATYQHYSITQAVFNISSDSLMLVVPVTLLRDTQMPMRKKLLLMGVLGLGVFVIIAAILNKYFNFHSPQTTIYQLWYIREASTAVYVANLMCWWPLLRKIFGKTLANYNSKYNSKYGRPSAPVAHSGTAPASASAAPEPSSTRWWRGKGANATAHPTTSTSQEAINLPGRESEGDVPLEIWRKVEYDVRGSPKPGV
ncbi:uncharacterized protein BJX67DRAFT_147787 [Aspergillus lucknowensis]|uniref:Rhodopsin domain-containing protein n=1 Tax=Aspergillus lucknowensis TaxID=176173 RepID=A0ABR4LNP4_9EURO